MSRILFCCFLLVLRSQASAQPTSASQIVHASLEAAETHLVSQTGSRPGPRFVDVDQIADVMEIGTGERLDPSSIVAAAGTAAKAGTRAIAQTCSAVIGTRVCEITDDGSYFTIESATVNGNGADVVVRYEFTSRRKSSAHPYLGFVKLRMQLGKESSAWRVISQEVIVRS